MSHDANNRTIGGLGFLLELGGEDLISHVHKIIPILSGLGEVRVIDLHILTITKVLQA